MFKNQTLASKFISNGFWMYFFTFLVAPLGYIIKVIISNQLTIEEVGVLYSLMGFIGILGTYNDLGLTASLSYFLPKFRIEKKYTEFKSSIVLSLSVQIITSIILGTLLWFGAGYLSVHYFQYPEVSSLLQWFAILFFVNNIIQVVSTVLGAFQDTFLQKLIDFIRMGLITIVVVYFFYNGVTSVDLYGLSRVWGTIVGVLFSILFFVNKYGHILKPGKIQFSKPFVHKYLSYAFWAFIASNAGLVLGQIDQQMIIYILGAKSAGFYTNYLSLINAIGLFTMPLIGFLYPVARESLSKKDGKFVIMRQFFYKYFSVFALMMGGFFAILGPEIASVLFGDKFEFSGTLFFYSGWFIVFQVLLSINFSLTGGLGLVKQNTKILGIAAVVNIILNSLLIPYIGVLGAVLSTVIGWFIMWIFTFKLLRKHYDFVFERPFFIKNIIYLLVFFVLIFIFKSDFITISDDLRYHNLGIIFGLVGVFCLYLGIANLQEMILLKNEVLKMIKKD